MSSCSRASAMSPPPQSEPDGPPSPLRKAAYVTEGTPGNRQINQVSRTAADALEARRGPPRQSLRSGARVSEGPGLAGSGNASVQTMSIKFTDTQLVLLSAASHRHDHCLGPPIGLQWRNHLGGLAPAHLPGWLMARVLAYRIQAAAFGDLDRAILRRLREMKGEALESETSSSLCDPRTDNARGRRAKVGSSPRSRMERPYRARHCPRRGVRLEWRRLPQPFAGGQGDHRHELERAPLLRAERRQERHLR